MGCGERSRTTLSTSRTTTGHVRIVADAHSPLVRQAMLASPTAPMTVKLRPTSSSALSMASVRFMPDSSGKSSCTESQCVRT